MDPARRRPVDDVRLAWRVARRMRHAADVVRRLRVPAHARRRRRTLTARTGVLRGPQRSMVGTLVQVDAALDGSLEDRASLVSTLLVAGDAATTAAPTIQPLAELTALHQAVRTHI
jgi:hypothetical protein